MAGQTEENKFLPALAAAIKVAYDEGDNLSTGTFVALIDAVSGIHMGRDRKNRGRGWRVVATSPYRVPNLEAFSLCSLLCAFLCTTR